MHLVFYLQACLVLVSANSLYEFNCCPNTYSSYGNDQHLVAQKNNYNPYLLSLLVPNSLNSITNSQSLPHQYQSLNTNNFVPNYQFYNRNGLEILQHAPETETEKVINNYILIPQEYFHNNGIENEKDEKRRQSEKDEPKIKNKNKSKRRRPNKSTKISNGNAVISNPDTKTTKLKGSREETDSTKSRRNKVKNNNKNNCNLLTDIVEPIPLKKVKKYEEAKTKHANNNLISSCNNNLMAENTSPSHKPNYQQPKAEELTKKELVKNYITDVNVKSKKKDDTGFADVNVCFDINEDCTDLSCRHTRNKDVNKKNQPQSSKQQQDLPNNFNNYMNSLTYNQPMNPNFFNPKVNFPFNFDYLYQTQQTPNAKPKDSNNRRRNKKRKQMSSNRQKNSNKKNINLTTTVSSCDKVVELAPEVETTTVAAKTTTHTVEPECNNVLQEEIPPEKEKDSNVENPVPTYTEILFTEISDNDEISNNNNVPFVNGNDVMDEYYPDFTLDNTYISSKEDYDFGNFHDRYFYAYGDKPELNRDRRKYDHPNGNKLNSYRKLNRNNQNRNTLQDSSHIKEMICKTETSKEEREKEQLLTPSILDFPGFKTEMINKEKYFAKDYDTNYISTNKKCSSKQSEGKENRNNNNVEMVFAKSKVVRYGAPEKEREEVITKSPKPEIKKEFKNLMSDDGKTTVVIAKSLGYLY